MTLDQSKIAFDSRLNYLKRNLTGHTTATYGPASSSVVTSITHGMDNPSFIAVGVELFGDGIIWSNEYVNEFTQSTSSGADFYPTFYSWVDETNISIDLFNGSGPNAESGTIDLYYVVYIDYGD